MAARNVDDAQLRFCLFSAHTRSIEKTKKKIYKNIYGAEGKNNKLTFLTDSHVHMGKHRQTHDNWEDHGGPRSGMEDNASF